MWKFKPTDDFSYLKNCNFTQLVIDKYQISFVFSEGYKLVSELGLRHLRKRKNEVLAYDIQLGIDAVYLHEILEQKVVAVTHTEWELRLSFEGGDEIHVLTDEGHLEAGHIVGPGVNFYVF